MKNQKTLFTLIHGSALIVCPLSQTKLHGENMKVKKPLRISFNQHITKFIHSRMKNLKTLFTLIHGSALIVCPLSQTKLHGENMKVKKPLRISFNRHITTFWGGRRIYLNSLVVKVELLF